MIQCTAPRSIAKSWLKGGMTKEHLEIYVLVMINESYERDHSANKFKQNVHYNYQYYFGSDLKSDVLEALREGDMESVAFREFFLACLDRSAEFKIRNRKFCKGTERYSTENPARGNVNRAVKRAFK